MALKLNVPRNRNLCHKTQVILSCFFHPSYGTALFWQVDLTEPHMTQEDPQAPCCGAWALPPPPPHAKMHLPMLAMIFVSSLIKKWMSPSFAFGTFCLWDRPKTSVGSRTPAQKITTLTGSRSREPHALTPADLSISQGTSRTVLHIYVRCTRRAFTSAQRSDSELREHRRTFARGMCRVFGFITKQHSSSFWNISSPFGQKTGAAP